MFFKNALNCKCAPLLAQESLKLLAKPAQSLGPFSQLGMAANTGTAPDGGLEACWRTAKVHEDLIKHMKTNLAMETLTDFVNYVGSKTYETDLLVLRDQVSGLKDDVLVAARLRTAWRAGHLTLQTMEARVKTGNTTDDLEVPLSTPEVESIQVDWQTTYPKIELDQYLYPCDTLLARTHKEFRRGSATVTPMSKVRSNLYDRTQRSHNSVAIGDRLTLLVGDDPASSEALPARSAGQYYLQLRILANSWALAGNFQTNSRKGLGSIPFLTYTQAMNYCDFGLRCCVERGSGSMSWFSERDQATRQRMVSYMRRGYPGGEALEAALNDSRLDWEPPTLSIAGRTKEEKPVAESRALTRQNSADSNKQAKKQKTGSAPQERSSSTVTTLPGGLKICKPYNDSRGCTPRERDCPIYGKHVCDRLLASGKVCGKSHSRCSP